MQFLFLPQRAHFPVPAGGDAHQDRRCLGGGEDVVETPAHLGYVFFFPLFLKLSQSLIFY